MTAAPTTQESVPTRREWLGLAVLSIGLGLIVLDGTDGYPVVRDRDLVAAATVDDRLWGDQRMLEC